MCRDKGTGKCTGAYESVMLGNACKEAHPCTIPVDIVGHRAPQLYS